MLVLALAMVVVLALSALILFYVAYPVQGRRMRGAGWLGDTMGRVTDVVPTLREDHLAEVRR